MHLWCVSQQRKQAWELFPVVETAYGKTMLFKFSNVFFNAVSKGHVGEGQKFQSRAQEAENIDSARKQYCTRRKNVLCDLEGN